MIARPPEKKLASPAKPSPSLFSKAANDNRPPKRITFGWALFITGFLLIISAFFFI